MPGGYHIFQIGPQDTNVVEDVEFLLPVKFRHIPFNGFRKEIGNVVQGSAYTNLV